MPFGPLYDVVLDLIGFKVPLCPPIAGLKVHTHSVEINQHIYGLSDRFILLSQCIPSLQLLEVELHVGAGPPPALQLFCQNELFVVGVAQ